MSQLIQAVLSGLTLLAVVGQNWQVAVADEATLIEELRQERDYEEIDRIGRDHFTQSDSSSPKQVFIAVAWLRAATQRALEAKASSRKKEWNKLSKIESLVRSATGAPRGVLINLQIALSQLARAEQELTSAPYQEGPAIRAVRDQYRSVITTLRKLEAEVTRLLQVNYRQSTSEQRASGWSRDELESLRRGVLVHLARAYRGQGLSFDTTSSDRVNSFTLALESLTDVVSLSKTDSSVWEARIEQVVCLRLLGRLEEARRLCKQWQAADPPPEFRKKLEQEWQQLLLES